MVTPPIEDNVVRVSISNELVNSTLQDEELQGILTIPNDDLDYLDYVEAVTEGGDTEGPFTAVQLDFTQLIPEEPRIELYTRYSYLSVNLNDTRTSQTCYLLTDVMFSKATSDQQIDIANNRAVIRISPYNNDGYFRIAYLVNSSGSQKSVAIVNGDRYAIITLPDSGNYYYYFHYCSSVANDDLGDIIMMDMNRSDNIYSNTYIKNTVYRVFVYTGSGTE